MVTDAYIYCILCVTYCTSYGKCCTYCNTKFTVERKFTTLLYVITSQNEVIIEYYLINTIVEMYKISMMIPIWFRYQTSGLHFRHTDNIVQWRRAMVSVGLPEIFMPETTDVYDKKNMPKAVFCLHALGLVTVY